MIKIKKHILLLLLEILFFQVVVANSHTFNIYFNLNKSTLHATDIQYIKSKIDSLSKFNISKIVIIGHTDSLADSLYNIRLSNRRAYEVKKLLQSQGFNENIIEIGYFGKERPVVKNDSEANRQLNRRAEIIVNYTDKVTLDSKKPCSKNDTIIRTRSGKEIVINGCEFEEIENCLEIVEQKTHNDFKKGIIVMSKNGQDLLNYGMLQVNLLDGCVDNQCFKNPIRIRFPITTPPEGNNLSWALVKGERTVLKLVKINGKLFYEMELNCPTSWINCNCKKNQKH